MKICILLQARMTSERLPGKILKTVLGKTLLEYELERLKRISNVDEVIVATTTLSTDDPVVRLCETLGFPYHRGSEQNVLSRFYEAAVKHRADVIVRICADCPLIDPKIVEHTVTHYLKNRDKYDYVSNFHDRRYPRGMDCEVFSFELLKKTFEEATEDRDKEHVTPYISEHPERYRLGGWTSPIDLSAHRWTVDTPDDFELIRRILEALYPVKPRFEMQDVVELVEKNPDWQNLNAHIKQKT